MDSVDPPPLCPSLDDFVSADEVDRDTLLFWFRAAQGELMHEREMGADVRRLLDDFQRQYYQQRRQCQDAAAIARVARSEELSLREHIAALEAENEELHLKCSDFSLKLNSRHEAAARNESEKCEAAAEAKEKAKQEAALYASELAMSKVKLATLLEEQDRLGKLVLFYASHIAECCPDLLVSPRDNDRIENLDFDYRVTTTSAASSASNSKLFSGKTGGSTGGAAHALLRAVGLAGSANGSGSRQASQPADILRTPNSVRSLPTRQQTVMSARMRAAAATPVNSGQMRVGWQRPPPQPPAEEYTPSTAEVEEWRNFECSPQCSPPRSPLPPVKARPFLPPLPLEVLGCGVQQQQLPQLQQPQQLPQQLPQLEPSTSSSKFSSKKWYKKLGDFTNKYTRPKEASSDALADPLSSSCVQSPIASSTKRKKKKRGGNDEQHGCSLAMLVDSPSASSCRISQGVFQSWDP